LWKKFAEGFLFLIGILILIAGPMLLFSSLNPVAQPNPVYDGYLEFSIQI